MKKIVFYTQPEWAFGAIHYELCKYLFKYGIDAHLLPWTAAYTKEELQELDKATDLFITNQHGYANLVYGYGAISPEKIMVTAHATLDLEELIQRHGLNEYKKPKAYTVVTKFLQEKSKELGISRIPAITPIAINTTSYDFPPSARLQTVGFAGSFHQRDEFNDALINGPMSQPKFKKRGYL